MNKMSINSKSSWQLCFSFCLIAALLAFPDIASAAASTDQTGIGTVMCKIVNLLTGTVGKAISVIAIVVLAIGIFMGKLSWSLALATAIGIGLIFKAPQMVMWLSGDTAQLDCSGVQ